MRSLVFLLLALAPLWTAATRVTLAAEDLLGQEAEAVEEYAAKHDAVDESEQVEQEEGPDKHVRFAVGTKDICTQRGMLPLPGSLKRKFQWHDFTEFVIRRAASQLQSHKQSGKVPHRIDMTSGLCPTSHPLLVHQDTRYCCKAALVNGKPSLDAYPIWKDVFNEACSILSKVAAGFQKQSPASEAVQGQLPRLQEHYRQLQCIDFDLPVAKWTADDRCTSKCGSINPTFGHVSFEEGVKGQKGANSRCKICTEEARKKTTGGSSKACKDLPMPEGAEEPGFSAVEKTAFKKTCCWLVKCSLEWE